MVSSPGLWDPHPRVGGSTKGGRVAQANYQFEKRKRDLAKKHKQEAKRQRKEERKKRQAAEASEIVVPGPEGTG